MTRTTNQIARFFRTKESTVLLSTLCVLLLSVAAPLAAQANKPGTAKGKAPAPRATKRTPPVKRRTQPVKAPAGAAKGTPKERFQQANQAYNKGDYLQASTLFLSLLKQDKRKSFSIFYNLGNCYYQLQQYGLSLAYYRKAQRLRPNDLNLLQNIQLLNKRAGRTESTIPQLRLKFLFWYSLLNLKQLFWLVLLLTYLGFVLWAVYIRRSSTKQLYGMRWYVVGVMAFVAILWLSLGLKVYREEIRKVGVVTVERITARSGYGAQYEPLFRLSQADEVIIKERLLVKGTDKTQQEWFRVELYLYDKQSKRRVRQMGWVPGSAIQTI